MAKDPARRFANGDELGQALRAYRRRAEELTSAVPVVTPGQPPRPAPSAARPAARPAPKTAPGPDLVTVILGLLAVLAVAGLISLWLRVYNVYTMPPVPASGVERSVAGFDLPSVRLVSLCLPAQDGV
jgi:hypothetical protein